MGGQCSVLLLLLLLCKGCASARRAKQGFPPGLTPVVPTACSLCDAPIGLAEGFGGAINLAQCASDQHHQHSSAKAGSGLHLKSDGSKFSWKMRSGVAAGQVYSVWWGSRSVECRSCVRAGGFPAVLCWPLLSCSTATVANWDTVSHSSSDISDHH